MTASVWPVGESEMAGRVRAHAWGATPLGPIETWPISLRMAVELTLGNPVASILLWGPAHTQIYNDHWRDVMGQKHPAALGQPTVAAGSRPSGSRTVNSLPLPTPTTFGNLRTQWPDVGAAPAPRAPH
jgi:hypothetical protein